MAVEFQRPPSSQGAINLTPLIDVIFQLLIFFMLTSSFIYPALDLDLPRAEAKDGPQDAQRLVISVDADGAVFINRQAVPHDRLKEALQLELSSHPDRHVFFRADRQMPYERFVEIMELASQAGARSFNLIHEPRD